MSDCYYEDSHILSEYLLFHYGTDQQVLPWEFGPKNSTQFPKRVAHLFAEHYPRKNADSSAIRALDLGCSVGRSSFELTTYADEVMGIDYSHTFVDAAIQLQRKGILHYAYKIQGDVSKKTIAQVPDNLNREKVSFSQGDAMSMDPQTLGQFDIIIASNLICRLPDPGQFLGGISRLMKKGGVFVLSSPFSWLEEFTKKSSWLGGRSTELKAFDAIRETLATSFDLIEQRDTPMFIREHERKYQWTVCSVSAWRMKQ